MGLKSTKQKTGQIYIAANNASDRIKCGADYVCDNVNDHIEIQAAINEAQSSIYDWGANEGFFSPEIILSAGQYAIGSPLYIGYSQSNGHWRPNQKTGCTLRGEGNVWLNWGGADQPHMNTFFINFSPDAEYVGRVLSNIMLNCNGKIAGIYTNRLNKGMLYRVYIHNSKFCGLIANDAWFGNYKHINISNANGMGTMFLRANGCKTEQLSVFGKSATQVPVIKSYNVDNWSESAFQTTFWPLEKLSGNSGNAGIFLGWSAHPASTQIVVHHPSGSGDFDENETITGESSTHTLDIDLASDPKYDLRCGTYFNCDSMSVNSLHFEEVNFNSSGLTTNYYPLSIIHGDNVTLRDIRYEEADVLTLADTFIRMEKAENCSIENVSTTITIGTAASKPSLKVDQIDQTVQDVGSSWASTMLENGDEVYLWDSIATGVTPGIYTISGVTGGVVTLNEDPGGDNGGTARLYAISAVKRRAPRRCVELIDCNACSVKNVRGRNFYECFVSIDTNCLYTYVESIYAKTDGANLAENWWVYYPRPIQDVINSGSYTTYINPHIFDASKLRYQNYLYSDGIKIPISSTVSVKTAMGPNYLIYLTGSGSINTLTNGWRGQQVRLVAFSGSCTLNDSANLDVGAGNLVLTSGYGANLICMNTDGNKWAIPQTA